MYIDYEQEFSIEKFANIPLQSQEDADAQSMPADSQAQPEEQQAAAEEAQESCANDENTSTENEDINEKAAEAYNIYLQRHPELSIEEQIQESEEKLNEAIKEGVDKTKKNVKKVVKTGVDKAKEAKSKIDERLKRLQERRKGDDDDPKAKTKKAQIEKHKKEAREEYMRRHGHDY